MEAILVDPHGPQWEAAIDQLDALLNAADNPTLFPYHFSQVVLPKLGGHLIWFTEAETCIGIGLVFPRALRAVAAGKVRRVYTLRYHGIPLGSRPSPITAQAAVQAVQPLLASAPINRYADAAPAIKGSIQNKPVDEAVDIVFYDPYTEHHYAPSSRRIDNIDIGRPDATEAAQIPDLHQTIWNSAPEFLYPGDIHSMDFAPGTSLVARVEGQLAAFLFGFTKFGGPMLPADWHTRFRGDLRLESQMMGVLPAYRGMRIGNLLKRMQAEEAWNAGIGVVQWTADPLQFPNAALNFGLLRALAYDFYTDYYPFRNDLNRVHASRFGLTWLVGSERVSNVPRTGARALILDLPQHPEILRVNDGHQQANFDVHSSFIAIEIPGEWTMLQQLDEAAAHAWRTATDQIFQHYVGREPGQYVITGVATDHDRRYLIGQRVNDALWTHLGQLPPGAE